MLTSRLSWNLTIYFYVALRSCVCSCPKVSRNVFLKKVFLVLIFQSTCFIWITWKREQTIEQQLHRACEWTKSDKNKKNKATSYSKWRRFLLFDLAHKQCNGIIKGRLHCLMSESKIPLKVDVICVSLLVRINRMFELLGVQIIGLQL